MWFEYLCEVIDLFESSFLACAVEENERTLVPIANCSPRVHRRGMSPMELVLNTIQIVPLLPVPCDPNFGRSASDEEGNLVRLKDL